MFMTATLMCVVWLAALSMLVQQVGFTDFADHTAPLMSGQVVLGDSQGDMAKQSNQLTV
jgi:hypothetical protein